MTAKSQISWNVRNEQLSASQECQYSTEVWFLFVCMCSIVLYKRMSSIANNFWRWFNKRAASFCAPYRSFTGHLDWSVHFLLTSLYPNLRHYRLQQSEHPSSTDTKWTFSSTRPLRIFENGSTTFSWNVRKFLQGHKSCPRASDEGVWGEWNYGSTHS